MSRKPFVHLHTHTAYSCLDGACKLKPLAALAKELGQPALAITDHGVVYGLVEFSSVCAANGIKPVLGCELYIVPKSSHKDRTDKSNRHILLLAETDEGYRNLCKLVSYANLDGFYYKPRIDRELLARHSKGLICMSACLHGEIPHLISEGTEAEVEEAVGFYVDVFGKDNFFLEVQDHGIIEQKRVVVALKELGRRHGLRLVATNDVHYLKQEHAASHEIMLAMQTQTVMTDPKRLKYATDQFYLKSREEMEAAFPEMPEALDITVEIAERCKGKIPKKELHFPVFPIPGGHADAAAYLRDVAGKELQRLYGIADYRKPSGEREKKVVERFDYELGIIHKTGFDNYFLVVRDFIQYAHDSGIPVGPGRGSGAGSMVAYACGITGLDPLQYDLIFERFLNPERVSPPDFDIDFCQTRRGEVIDYVKRRYGTDHVAQIVTFGALGAKTLVRDLARTLEIPLAKADAIAKTIPDAPDTTYASARQDSPEFERYCTTDPDMLRMVPHMDVLEDLYRNTGVHAAGVVIGEKPLVEIIPLGKDKNGQVISQYDKKAVEEVGLLKMDFLGLKNLTILKEAVALVRQLHGVEIDLQKLDLTDKDTYKIYSTAETVGIFQFESEGMQRYLQELAPTRIEEIIAMNALYRPGPMDVIPEFIKRKKGEKKVTFDHELLKPIVEETYGFMVYQEQVLRAANVLAGYSLGRADILRRAMGKKDEELMAKERAHFIEGCATTNRIPAELARKIFDNIQKFAGYGFNKSHSAAYAVVSFQTAYMKAHWPAEFISAVITFEMGNFDKMPFFITEAARMGFTILPPDVNRSQAKFVPEEKGIRYGMAGVKGVGDGAAQAIVDERVANGPYASYEDFVARIDVAKVNKKAVESLVKCGALDGFGLHRARLLHAMETVFARVAVQRQDRESGQASLFELLAEPAAEVAHGASHDDLPDCAPWTRREELVFERELTGIYLSGHPLTRYRHLAPQMMSLAKAQELLEAFKPNQSRDVRIFALVSAVTKKINKDKKPWAILSLEDEQGGQFEGAVYWNAYERLELFLQPNMPAMVCGELRRSPDGRAGFSVHEVHSLDDVPAKYGDGMGLCTTEEDATPERIARLKAALQAHRGNVPVTLRIRTKDGQTVTQRLPAELHIDARDGFNKALAEMGGFTIQVALKPAIYLAYKPRYRPE